MKKLALILLAISGMFTFAGCGQYDGIKCTSDNAANDYKCCPTGRFDPDGECDD